MITGSMKARIKLKAQVKRLEARIYPGDRVQVKFQSSQGYPGHPDTYPIGCGLLLNLIYRIGTKETTAKVLLDKAFY